MFLFLAMILVWSRKAIAESSRTRRCCRETEEPVNNWLCLLPTGYLPKPGSVGVRICHHHRIQPRPQVKVIFRYLRPDASVSTSTVFTAPGGVVTFRQSPCWYYPWADAAVSTSTDTQYLWTWWHFGDHAGLINLSVNKIGRIHTHRSR